jgi:hypothetical protein
MHPIGHIPRLSNQGNVFGQIWILFNKRNVLGPAGQGFESIAAQACANIQNTQSSKGMVLTNLVAVKPMDHHIKGTLAHAMHGGAQTFVMGKMDGRVLVIAT